MSYAEGFEDACELCLDEIRKSNEKEGVICQIEEMIRLIKANKFEKLKQMLTCLK